MADRLNYAKAFPDGINAVLNLERVIRASGLEASLLELVKIRASQLNGCANCIDMHTKDARVRDETKQRMNALSAWPRHRFLPCASAPRWPGPRLSPTSSGGTRRTPCARRSVGSLTKPSW
jgi:AhpD family alkylhydroperoxidase